MSYIGKRIVRRRRAARCGVGDIGSAVSALPGGGILSGLLGINSATDAINNSIRKYGQDKTVECLNAANAYTAKLDAKWYSLAQTWRPNPAFAPADLKAILGVVANVMVQAQTRLLVTPWNTADATSVIQEAMGDLTTQIDDTARFQDAITLAITTGSPYVNAPDIKDWVLQSLIATSQAYAVAYVETCDVTWLEHVLEMIDNAVTSIPHYVGVALETAVAVAADAGAAIVDVAAGAFNLVKFVGKYGLLMLLGAGGLYVYKHYYAK